MAIFEGSRWTSTRTRLRTLMQTMAGAPPVGDERSKQLAAVLQLRGELGAGVGELLRMLAPSALADTLGDPERIAAYAESLSAEALIRDASGESDRADALRRQAVAIAREAQRRARVPDTAVDRLIAGDGRIEAASS